MKFANFFWVVVFPNLFEVFEKEKKKKRKIP